MTSICLYGTEYDLHVFIHHKKWQFMNSRVFSCSSTRVTTTSPESNNTSLTALERRSTVTQVCIRESSLISNSIERFAKNIKRQKCFAYIRILYNFQTTFLQNGKLSKNSQKYSKMTFKCNCYNVHSRFLFD